MTPTIIIIEDLDRFFAKSEEDQIINFDDKKTKLLYSLIHEIENLWHSSLEENANKSTEKNGDFTKSVDNHREKNKVLIISSCSNIDKIDTELRKPGNLDYLINLNPPDQLNRKKLFVHFSQFFNNSLSEDDFEILADKSHGFVPTDIIQIFK
jgi:SpoVK/Ycf46/Vps4 family AAA+-type ATPase